MALLKRVSAILVVALVGLTCLAAAEPSIEGLWRSNDAAGKPRAYIRLRQVGDEYQGVVQKVFPGPGETEETVCSKCTDERKDKRILGMKILDSLRRSSSGYSGGNILDADNGKVYRATVTPSADGKELNLRGYVGIPLFGRTAVWTRIE